MWGDDAEKDLDFRPHDDPMAVVSRVQAHQAKITDNLWDQQQIRPEEIPTDLQEEIKESGQVAVTFRDVRQSIGKDRQQWTLALESELQSLKDTGAIEPVSRESKSIPWTTIQSTRFSHDFLTIEGKRATPIISRYCRQNPKLLR